MPSVYEVITARIVDKLEAGTVPWHKPWSVETGASRNLTSGRPYRGINIFLLACQPYTLPFWGAYKEMTEPDGEVRKISWGSLGREDRPFGTLWAHIAAVEPEWLSLACS